jgi:hypothetical protein
MKANPNQNYIRFLQQILDLLIKKRERNGKTIKEQ